MIYAANLKCNHTRSSFSKYVNILENSLLSDEIIIFPPASAFLQGEFNFSQGAQNFYPVSKGSFTGEIGESMLNEFGIKTVLIGHSERRELGESEELLRAKFNFAKEKNWTIVYCIGENLQTYQDGKTKEFLSKQLENLDLEYENLIIAYEPIWAIGTGKSASIRDISEVLDFISTKTKAKLLYGGSVNLNNISSIKDIDNCDGVLVGTASWDASEFLKLMES